MDVLYNTIPVEVEARLDAWPSEPSRGSPTLGAGRAGQGPEPINGQKTPLAGPRVQGGLTLFVDADDTLWENNIYFEQVVRRYCQLVARRGVAPPVARQVLLDLERVRTRTHGYGIASFNESLRQACRRLIGEDCDREVTELDRRCQAIRHRRLELIPGVEPTLRALASRHRLVMLTKGDEADQHDKLRRSGLASWFAAVDVVSEKHPETYREALQRHGVEPAGAWMIGNSPRSDIAPALEVGLGAVLIPHPATWVLELEPLPPGPHGRLIVLDRFEQLAEHF